MSNKNFNDQVNAITNTTVKPGQGKGESYDMTKPENPLGQIWDAFKSGQKRKKSQK